MQGSAYLEALRKETGRAGMSTWVMPTRIALPPPQRVTFLTRGASFRHAASTAVPPTPLAARSTPPDRKMTPAFRIPRASARGLPSAPVVCGLRRRDASVFFANGKWPDGRRDRDRNGMAAPRRASHGVLSSLNRPDTEGLSAPPEGVTDLAFAEFFEAIGDRGLEYSVNFRALEGKRVRLVGVI